MTFFESNMLTLQITAYMCCRSSGLTNVLDLFHNFLCSYACIQPCIYLICYLSFA